MTKRYQSNDLELVQITKEDFRSFIQNIKLENYDLNSMKNLIDKFGYEQLDRYWLHQSKSFVPLLIVIAQEGHQDLLEFLLENAEIIDRPIFNAATTIQHTIKVENPNQKGVRLNIFVDQSFELLTIASSKGYTKVVELLIEKGSIVEKHNSDYSNTPLIVASKNGYIEIVKLLLDNGANVDNCDEHCITALMHASYMGYTEIVKLLLENDVNIEATNSIGCTSLIIATGNGNTKIVELLLTYRANIEATDNDSNNSLLVAVENRHIEIVELLINNKANIEIRNENQYKYTPLILAVTKGYCEIVKILLDYGANIEAGADGKYKYTSLLFAAMRGHHEIVKILLDYGANVEVRDLGKYQYTPLLLGSSNGHIETVKILLDYGANIEVRDKSQYNSTPLLHAIDKYHIELVKVFLSRGANIEASENGLYKFTPLLLALKRGYNEIIKILILNSCELPGDFLFPDIKEEALTLINVAKIVNKIYFQINISVDELNEINKEANFALSLFNSYHTKNSTHKINNHSFVKELALKYGDNLNNITLSNFIEVISNSEANTDDLSDVDKEINNLDYSDHIS